MTRTPLRTAAALGLAILLGLNARAQAQELYWEVSPFLTLADPEDWKFTVRIQVDNFEDRNISSSVVSSYTRLINVDSGTVYYPIAPATAHAQTFFNRTEAVLRLGDFIVDESPTILIDRGKGKPMPAGAFLAAMEFGKQQNVGEMSLVITTYGRSWETIYNEEEAAKIPWPKKLPPIAQSLFEPEIYIDQGPFGPYDLTAVRAKVMEWTEGDPKALPPSVTAKWLAWKVAEAFRPSNRGVAGPIGASTQGAATDVFAAFLVDGPAFALERGRGSRFNLPVLLVAAYRAAGIPARVVIGYDFQEDELAGKTISDASRLTAWVEFALYDPTQPDEKKRLTWIPVDIIELQKRSVWLQPFDRPLRFFGTHKELDEVIPIAFHFSPYWVPGTSYGRYSYYSPYSRSYYRSRYDISADTRIFAPSLWSWNVLPAPPAWAGQWLNFSQETPPRTARDPLPAGAHRGAVPRRNP
jgi:Transglutaminase-like superfamily